MLTERIYVCTTKYKSGLMRECLGQYLVEEEGPTNEDPGYLFKADIPLWDFERVRQSIITIAQMIF